MKKKRPFLLLEILIAFLLVELSIVPLVRQPLTWYRKEMQQLENMELERLADWTFIEIKEMLLKQEIPWKKIPPFEKSSASFSLPTVTVDIPGHKPRTVKRKFHFRTKGEKIGSKHECFRQVYVYVDLNQKKYEFRIPVQNLSVE